ncbi:MAG: hypothetical protein WC341_04240 [Bacteroidales bacterium]|jgi:diphosphomevalonate decarboxylase
MQGKMTWESPSNIALVKYWGKYGDQLPQNPSLSMTLRKAITTTSIHYSSNHNQEEVKLSFLFDDRPNADFEKRLFNYLVRLTDRYPLISRLGLEVSSRNTFPHSSGIASSASAFSALALGLLSVIEEVSGEKRNTDSFFQEASNLARMGSGSASRSVYGGYVVWGRTDGFPKYSNSTAHPVTTAIHPVFQEMHDSILIVNAGTKKVGSSAGHGLMNTNPFAMVRYQQAEQHVIEMHQVLTHGDLERFIQIVEQEALTLHALMMASQPGYLLLEGGTLAIIDRVKQFRNDTKIPLCFTLDAGPNVHLLYPASHKAEIDDLIKRELLLFCTSNHFLDDGIGHGPTKVTNQG